MPFVRIFRKVKMSQKCHFCEISAHQESSKTAYIYQNSRHFLLPPRGGATRNHGNFLQKSRYFPSEITATSFRNHLEKLRKSSTFPSVFLRITDYSHGGNNKKSPRKVAESIRKNTVKMLNVGECR